MKQAIFLDRDGTVNAEPADETVDSLEKIRILPNALPALKLLSKHCQLFFVTNQLGISKGQLTTKKFHEINENILSKLEKGGVHITDTFFCPHALADDCACRKPRPGMLHDAAKKHGIDLKKSWMIGDRQTDVQAGRGAGCKTILVRTGKDKPGKIRPDYVATDLLDAAGYINKQQ